MNWSPALSVIRRSVVKNFFLKFIALTLALSLYIWVSEDRETVVAGYAPIRMVVPDGLVLVSEPIDRVKITFRGRWSDINRFDPSNLDPIRLDLSVSDADSVVTIGRDRVAVPPSIRVTDIEPDSIFVDLEREDLKNVTLRPRIVGDPRTSYTIEDVRIRPETITIRGPISRLEQIDSVYTERVDITDQTNTVQRQVRPDIADGLITAELDTPIELVVEIVTEEIDKELTGITVDAVNTSYVTSVEPDTAQVIVRGPQSIISTMNEDLIRAEIDLTEEDERPPGTFSRPAEVVNLPPDVDAIQIYPQRFRVVTTRPAGAPDEEPAQEEDTTDESL